MISSSNFTCSKQNFGSQIFMNLDKIEMNSDGPDKLKAQILKSSTLKNNMKVHALIHRSLIHSEVLHVYLHGSMWLLTSAKSCFKKVKSSLKAGPLRLVKYALPKEILSLNFLVVLAKC